MMGYAEAVIERQDRWDVMKKTQSFEIETKARLSLRELTGYYFDTHAKLIGEITEVKETVSKAFRELSDLR